MAGLDANGLTIKRLPEVLEDIETSEKSLINPDISTDPDTLLGQLNNIISASVADLWALAESINDNFNIDKAEGKNLDDLAALRKVTRISASKTNTDRQQFVGTDGTLIPAGSLFANPVTGDRFKNPDDVQLTSGSCLSATLSVKQVLNNTTYDIEVSGTTYTHVSSGSATANSIVTAFQTLINADINAKWTASLNGDNLIITSDDLTRISIVTVTYISADSVTTEGSIEALVDGDIIAPTNSITQIVTIISGLQSTTNNAQAVIGREVESDEELRIRIKTTSASDCTGTIPAIEDAILNNVAGVSSVKVTENTTATTDVDGRPPHSYETVVVGGDNADVASELWRTKPAGIQLHGNTYVVTVDSNGNNRDIYFTRPVAINFAVRVRYVKYNEEAYPVTGNDLISAAVLDYINALDIDKDVIPSRLFGPIYSATTGIDSLTVEVQTLASAGDPPVEINWQTTKYAIASDEFASITLADIIVEDVTP